MTSLTHRYCRRCGARLARDNAEGHCGPCQVQGQASLLNPPAVSAEFWDIDLMRDALDRWHMGKVIAAYRNHPFHVRPLSQQTVAGWLGMTQPQLSRLENGPPMKDLDKLALWADTLGIPTDLLWFRLRGERSAAPVVASKERLSDRTPSVLLSVNRDGGSGVRADAAAMGAFRLADRQVGGGHMYATVVRYLRVEVAPRLFGNGSNDRSPDLFSAAAALTEMAGWMAHDAGQDALACQHFNRALDLSRASNNGALRAHIFASLSNLAHHLKRPNAAIGLARRGQAVLRGLPRDPELVARLHAMMARGYAALNRPAECASALMCAETALGTTPAQAPCQWVSRFDEASFASEAARCLRELGQLPQGQRQAERVVALRVGDRARSRAFGQLMLAGILGQEQRLDEACAIGHEVLDGTQALASYRVIQELRDLGEVLRAYPSAATVSGFLGRLHEALSERMCRYDWVQVDEASVGTGESR